MNVIPLGNDAMRASDQDREGVVAVLCDAYAVGRLGLTDIRDRADAAYRARTWGDLRRLTVDLPCHQALRPARAGLRRGTRFGQAPKPSCAPILLAVLAVLAMTAAVLVPAAFAPAVPLAGLALITISLSALCAACLIFSLRDPAARSSHDGAAVAAAVEENLQGGLPAAVDHAGRGGGVLPDAPQG